MKKKLYYKDVIIIGIASILLMLLLISYSRPQKYTGIYMGQYGWNVMPKEQTLMEYSRIYKFQDEKGNITRFKAKKTDNYDIQNKLMIGYKYSLNTQLGKITELQLLDDLEEYRIDPIVAGTSGKRTLKNFLQIALEPAGNTEYIFGGGWNWQDNSGSRQTKTIGLSPEWNKFFNEQDVHYIYDDESNPEKSYAQKQGVNAYYYAGLDCSGYVGWAIYNLLNTKSGGDSYVDGCKISEYLDTKQHLGQFTDSKWEIKDLKPGDIICTDSHVWIYIGGCGDGSGVILHCTVIPSREGGEGGGVQLSALNPTGNKECEALKLVKYYMSTYYKEWYSRYDPVLKDYDVYVHFPREEYGGLFRWNLSGQNGNIMDPDGYESMNAAEILGDLFN